jgi:hypothetical protein
VNLGAPPRAERRASTTTETVLDPATSGTAGPSCSRRRLILAVAGVAQVMVVLDTTVVNIALPSAQRALHCSSGGRQGVVTACALAFGSLLPLGGRIGDLVGQRGPPAQATTPAQAATAGDVLVMEAYNDDPDRDGRSAELADGGTTSLPGAALRPRAHDRPTRLAVATERRRPSARVA